MLKLEKTYELSWLTDPQVFQVNKLPYHSDHDILNEKGEGQLPFSLNGKWKFAYFEDLEDVNFNLINNDNEKQLTNDIQVPAHIQLQGFGYPQYVNTMYPWDGCEKITPPQIPSKNPVGWYSRYFDLPNDYLNKEVRICFEGVEPCLYIWLNGKFIGYSENSFSHSEFDLTSAIKEKDNYICVMVVRFCTGSWLEDQDFWRFSGIFRDVNLYCVDKVFVEDLHVIPQLDESLKNGNLKSRSLIKCTKETSISARFELLEASICENITLDCKEGLNELVFDCCIYSPKLWDSEQPNLYTFKVTLFDKDTGEFLTSVKTEIGFRRFEMKNKIMHLNGKRIIFRGVNRHEFHHKKGRAISAEEIEWDLKTIKQNNFNAVRTSHYPNNSLFYRLCDKYGLYVIDEANLETHGTWMIMGKVVPTENTLPYNNLKWQESVLDRAKSLVERDKNHPSILIWSCGNESYAGDVLKNMADWFRKRDDSRLVHYEGVFHNRDYDETSDIESQMYTKPQDVEEYLKNNPKKPIIMCEYAHAMGNSCGNVNLYTELEDKYPMYQGGFIWDFIDQSLEKDNNGVKYLAVGGDFSDRPNDAYFCGNGLVFADRTITPKMSEIKYLYQPLNICCNNEGVLISNRNFFASTKNYNFVWILLCNGKEVQRGELNIDIAPNEKKLYPLNLSLEKNNCEYILECKAIISEDAPWAKKGHEVAFGQGILNSSVLSEMPKQEFAELIDGDCNIGAVMDNGFAMISKATGKIYSIRNRKAEFIKNPIALDFWRAPTDNDRGNRSPAHWAQWKVASMYSYCESIYINDEKNKVIADFLIPTNPKRHCKVEYEFFKEGVIKVSAKLDKIEEDIPCFGITFKMPGKYQKLKWYGNSQSEAYVDRENGCRISENESIVNNEYIPYLKPQECANKTQLRYLLLSDEDGNKIKIFADKAFEGSALPYTSHELENADNITSLPPKQDVVVSVYSGKCGVGGDDSWGAPVHEQYLFKSENNMKFSFFIKIL